MHKDLWQLLASSISVHVSFECSFSAQFRGLSFELVLLKGVLDTRRRASRVIGLQSVGCAVM